MSDSEYKRNLVSMYRKLAIVDNDVEFSPNQALDLMLAAKATKRKEARAKAETVKKLAAKKIENVNAKELWENLEPDLKKAAMSGFDSFSCSFKPGTNQCLSKPEAAALATYGRLKGWSARTYRNDDEIIIVWGGPRQRLSLWFKNNRLYCYIAICILCSSALLMSGCQAYWNMVINGY